MMAASSIEESAEEIELDSRVLGFIKPNTAMVAIPSDATADEELFQNEDAFWPTAPQDLPSMHVEHPKLLLKHKTRASLSEQAGVPARVMATFELWHQRLCHIAPAKLKQMNKLGLGGKGFNLDGPPSDHQCNCAICRMTKMKAKGQKRKNRDDGPSRVGERVSTDLKSIPHDCWGGYKYIAPFVDH